LAFKARPNLAAVVFDVTSSMQSDLDAAGEDHRQRPLQRQGIVWSAVSHVSTSFGVVRMTGISFGWIALTSAFGSVVRKLRGRLTFQRP
jgi:hypothetical protein